MKSLLDTRTFVFDKLSETFDKSTSQMVEKSILQYAKNAFQNKFKADQLRWSDVRFRRLYLRKFRMVMANSMHVNQLISNGDVLPNNVSNMTHQDLRPDIYEPYLSAKQKREALSILVDSEDKHDGILKCEQCNNFKTRYIELQTRGADEPMTVFAMCLDCDHHWTLNGK